MLSYYRQYSLHETGPSNKSCSFMHNETRTAFKQVYAKNKARKCAVLAKTSLEHDV